MCPFAERSDPRCGRHLRLDDLAWAFSRCVEHPTTCPIYWEITLDDGQLRRVGPDRLVASS